MSSYTQQRVPVLFVQHLFLTDETYTYTIIYMHMFTKQIFTHFKHVTKYTVNLQKQKGKTDIPLLMQKITNTM